MTPLRIVPVAWFVTSVLIVIVSQMFFYVWLLRRGARPQFMWAGMPGYLDGIYIQWCEARGRSARRVLFLRRASYINLALAVLSAIFGFPG